MVQPLKRLLAFFRGVYYATLTGNLSITTEMPQHYSLNGGLSDRNLTFYAPSEDYKGAIYEFYNRGTTNSLVVKDSGASTIVTILPAQSARVMWDPTNGWVKLSVSGAGAGGSDFGAPGLLSDVIGESTSAAGVTIDGLLVKDGFAQGKNVTDPGNAGAIPVTASGSCPLVTAGAETRTLANPSAINQILTLYFKTDGGDCVVTAASAFNATGNNTITLNDAGDSITLRGIHNGTGLVWRVMANDGTSLSTV